MPDIFSPGAKVKLIEYGSDKHGFEAFAHFKDALVAFLQKHIQK